VNTLYKGDKDKDNNNNNNNNNVPPILYYKYQPQIHVIKLQLQAILRQSLIVDRAVHNNRSDIAVFDIIMKEAHSVDTAIPNNQDLHSTTTERLHKYTDLKEELITIWQL
jgi:hypothetical protein